ncbi:MAG: S1 RNA-binding domain-containing protein [Anaerolineae bacterium]|nr:S1 RNA-binding domain-containing protein [Anaerolineae bacterium]
MTAEKSTPTTIDDIAPKMKLQGTVKKVDLYGALVDVGIGRLGLLHISQLSDGHVNNVTDVVTEGDEIAVWVQDVDRNKGRISLTMIKPPDLTWSEISQDDVYTGTVVRVEKFGAFIDVGAERPGLVHVSELAKGYVGDPSEVVKVNDEVQVKVIGVNRRKKQIDLSVRALEEPEATVHVVEEEDKEMPTAMELALRQAMENSGMDMPRRASNKKKRAKRNKRRDEREDIFARTLQQHSGE